MVELERFASGHEALVEVLRNLPRLVLIRFLCVAAEIELVDIDIGQIHDRTPTVEVPGVARRARRGMADVVLVVHSSREQIWMVWVLEVQLCWDHTKQWNWALLPVAFAAEVRRTVRLAAFVPDPVLRRRYRTQLIPKIVPRPILIERDQIELIVDTDDAHRRPHESVLGAVFHAREDHALERRVAGFRAAYLAIQTLDPGQCMRYTVLMLSTAPTAVAQAALDEVREFDELDELDRVIHLDPFDEFDEANVEDPNYILRGSWLFHRLHRAYKQGQVQLLRRFLVQEIEQRGFVVTLDHRAHILACDDLERLERWYTNARTLATDTPVEQLFE